MNPQGKSTKKSSVQFFTAKEKIELYEAMRKDKKWYERLGSFAYNEAIQVYAKNTLPPEKLTFKSNMGRIADELHRIDQQIGAIIDSNCLSGLDRDTLLESFAQQRVKLLRQRAIFIKGAKESGEDITEYMKPNGHREFLGLVTPVGHVEKKTTSFHARPISVPEAISVTETLVDYFEALKTSSELPKKPDHRLAYLLRCNTIVRLQYETSNKEILGAPTSNWALSEKEVVFAWLWSHMFKPKNPITHLGLRGIAFINQIQKNNEA